jgi:hypothetical protein
MYGSNEGSSLVSRIPSVWELIADSPATGNTESDGNAGRDDGMGERGANSTTI